MMGLERLYDDLTRRAREADRVGHARYYAACRWDGHDPGPESEPLIVLAARLYRLRNHLGRALPCLAGPVGRLP
jgi:hypothetical protein